MTTMEQKTSTSDQIHFGQSRMGSYAKNSSFFASGATSKKKQKKEKSAIYPIFSDCMECITDAYWKRIFINASFGKFPRGFSFRDGILSYKKKNKIFSMGISTDPYVAYEEVYSFMKNNANMMSNEEKIESHIANLEIEEKDLTWTSISNRSVKDLYISSYAKDLIHKNLGMSYGKIECSYIYKHFVSIVHIGLIIGHIKPKDIELDEYGIKKIHGIDYDEDEKRFYICEEYKKRTKPKSRASKSTKKSDTIIDKWVGYLDTINPNRKGRKIDDSDSTSIQD